MSDQRPNPEPSNDGRDALSRDSSFGMILSEEALLDWVDGRVSSADAAAMADASGRRGLAARVTQMQANKRVLNALPLEKAPGDLAERVVQALEREALLALADGQPSGSIPISTYQDHARGRRRTQSAWRVPAAMAAGLALILGGVSYMAYTVFKPAPSHTLGPLAQGDPRASVPHVAPDAPDSTGTVGAALTEAMNASQGEQPTTMAAAAGPDTTPSAHAAIAGIDASAAPLPASSPTIDDARALELARERRLAVRVRGASTRSLPLLAQNSGRVWSLEPGMDEGVKVALDTQRQDRYDRMLALARGGHDDAMLASAEDRSRFALRSLAGVAPLAIQPPSSIIMVPAPSLAYTAELPDGTPSLLSLKATLAARLGGSVSYVELDQALPTDPAAAAMRTLWWTEPPSAWSPRVRVPVYIEPLQ